MMSVIVAAMVVWCAGMGEAGGEPPLAFERTIIDLGPVSDDAAIKQPFRFVYTGGRWTRVKFEQCHHCPVPETDKERYEPGESGLVILELPTQGKHGEAEVTTTAYSELDPVEKVPLVLRASVRPRVMVKNESEEIAEISRGRGGEATVMVIGRRKGFEVTGAETESAWARASVGEGMDVEDLGDACRGFRVRVEVKAGAPLGAMTIPVKITTTDAARREVPVVVGATIVGDLVAEPVSASAGVAAPGEAFGATFVVSRRDGAPLWLGSVKLRVEPARGMTGVAVDAMPALDEAIGSLRVSVSGVAPPFATQLTQAAVFVSIEDEKGGVVEELRVPVRLIVRAAGVPRTR